ncbi:hypothetical protein BJY24_001105 [Nocardia transvalensis]|uniref:Uncharacterized protein n=1 Tax=Nocardia transvalensis TaxID=37333 RepID=A0A7W9PAM4_9NOCA|nr:hypothetical protein [Nocardia transvalensis]MBB5912238.1 hypothetical protein [Nocardia transvalensis]
MSITLYIASIGNAPSAISYAPASRGVLALQGTGLSGVSILGADVPAPQHAIETDKPERGWHLAFADAHADAFANAGAADHPMVGMPAARLRRTKPATVIRSRHRSRLR